MILKIKRESNHKFLLNCIGALVLVVCFAVYLYVPISNPNFYSIAVITISGIIIGILLNFIPKYKDEQPKTENV